MDHYNPYSLQGKTILITGASSGIGRGIAVECAKFGAVVILTGRNEVKLNETLALMEGEGHRVISADLTNAQDIGNLVNKIPQLNGIVHCAGIGQRKLCKQIDEQDIDSIFAVNFKAPVMLQTQILKMKKLEKEASIIFLASIASESSSIGNSLYSATKGALISYSNCLKLELAPRKIRVNCISPAMVWTDLVMEGGITKADLQEDEKTYPLKRYGTPEDISFLAIYLLSDVSAWMTGSNLKITGGRTVL